LDNPLGEEFGLTIRKEFEEEKVFENSSEDKIFEMVEVN
jgi:hypothetical protein